MTDDEEQAPLRAPRSDSMAAYAACASPRCRDATDNAEHARELTARADRRACVHGMTVAAHAAAANDARACGGASWIWRTVLLHLWEDDPGELRADLALVASRAYERGDHDTARRCEAAFDALAPAELAHRSSSFAVLCAMLLTTIVVLPLTCVTFTLLVMAAMGNDDHDGDVAELSASA